MNKQDKDIQWREITGEDMQKQVTERCRKAAAMKLAASANIELKLTADLKPECPRREVNQPKLGDVIIDSDIDHRGREVNKRVRIFGMK
jgi:hypothetical protein